MVSRSGKHDLDAGRGSRALFQDMGARDKPEHDGKIMTILMPYSEASACAMVADAIKARTPLSVTGGGTRSGLGRPNQTGLTLSASKLSGITLYEPAEMVIGAKSGTPLKTIEETLAAKGQMLPFEPMDHRTLYGTTREPTIGAVASGNISGPRRINGGAARDSLIGVRLINGKGEAVKSGGRVMKNVTGLDLVKLVCGAHGTLGFLTEVTFRVLPAPEKRATLVIEGLDDAKAVAALSAALGSPFEPMAASHLPAGIDGARARTLLRLEGFAGSLAYRGAELTKLLAGFGRCEIHEGPEMEALWTRIRDCAPLAAGDAAIWRISVAPTKGPATTRAIAAAIPGASWYYDWGGGLIWLAVPATGDAGEAIIRSASKAANGHATLVRAPLDIRASIAPFEPLSEPLMRVTAGIKTSFDPSGIFEPGRMYAGI
jgi:glycolate oxidase FAD binding subunit